MKKSILFLILMITVSSFGQNHFKFKGIPINGTIYEFKDSLIKNNFEYVGLNKNDNLLFKGSYMNKKCELIVLKSPKTNIVCALYISFERKNSSSSSKDEYNIIFETLRQKYGAPKSDYKLYGTAIWSLDDASIMLIMIDNQNNIRIEDKVNIEKSSKEAKELFNNRKNDM